MAVKLTYDGVQFPDGTTQEYKNKPREFWVYNERMHNCQACANNGNCCEIANGKCCQWTVPEGVTTAKFDIWSGGGGGAGMTCANCCSHSHGGSGGGWAVKSIDVDEGTQYTICAGGVYACEKFHGCTGGQGCASYVNGPGLSNFCVIGGCGGKMCNGDAWGFRNPQTCANCNICMHFGADFGMAGTTGMGSHTSAGCHCGPQWQMTGQAPMIGLAGLSAAIQYWCTCACYINGFATGGNSGLSTYCNSSAKCCAGGGMGGPGLVKVTYA
jgi:hypothetical protein